MDAFRPGGGPPVGELGAPSHPYSSHVSAYHFHIPTRNRTAALSTPSHVHLGEKIDEQMHNAKLLHSNVILSPSLFADIRIPQNLRLDNGPVPDRISHGDIEVELPVSLEASFRMLHKCIEKKDLASGRGVHLLLISNGVDSIPSVVTALIELFESCGSLEEADLVFSKVAQPNLAAWHAIIVAHYTHGSSFRALEIFRKMEEEGIVPDDFLFTCALKCCAHTQAVIQGQFIHVHVIETGLVSSIFVASSLINFYVKTGNLQNAWIIFNILPYKNVVTWSTMIDGCVENRYLDVSIQLFKQMQHEGIEPNEVTYLSIFNACGSLGDFREGMLLHNRVVEDGLDDLPRIGNSLIDMYAKCGRLEEAHDVFDNLENLDLVSWNALISGYTLNEQGPSAFQVFQMMLMKGLRPNNITLSCILKACAVMGCIQEGMMIHHQIIEEGVECDEHIQSGLIDMYCKCQCLNEASNIFAKWPDCKNIISWGAMMAGYAQHNHGHIVLNLYAKMQEAGIIPNKFIFSSVLKSCSVIGALEEGVKIHEKIHHSGIQVCPFLGSILIAMYAKCGDLEAALKVFEDTRSKDVILWGAMIGGYIQHGHYLAGLKLYERMGKEGPDPDQAIYVSLLSACGSLGITYRGQILHCEINAHGWNADTTVGNSLLDMYVRCEALQEAEIVFNGMDRRDEASWSTMVAMHAQHGNYTTSRQYLKGMEEENLKPDGILFTSILASCKRAGKLEEGLKFFRCMSEDYDIRPVIEHFGCMVDLLGQAGRLEEAEELLASLHILPDAAAWLSLLAACKKHTNVKLGRQCFDQVIRLDSSIAVAYVLMSNIYADAGMLEDARAIDNDRKSVNIWKVPGRAWIEINKELHEFVVGDRTHPQSDKIYANLRRLSVRLRAEGYVPRITAVVDTPPEESKEEALLGHCEKLAIAFGLLNTAEGVTLRITKNLRVCTDCHNASKIISKVEKREIIINDSHQIHHFDNGMCSCDFNRYGD